MPGGDRTGPIGRGPMTGRALGYCAGYNAPGFANTHYGLRVGRGFGRGFRGRGRGFWFRDPYYRPPSYDLYTPPNTEEEKDYLQGLIKDLEGEIKIIKKRLQEVAKEKEESSN